MPSSARKSSVGAARRGLQKAHIPYRGDNPEVGKKTGIAVGHVERMSDGFEPFDQVIQQADNRTPPRPKRRKKSVPAVVDNGNDNEDGEMSMDIEQSMSRPEHHHAYANFYFSSFAASLQCTYSLHAHSQKHERIVTARCPELRSQL
jgi:hypothetical protein